MHIAVLSDPNHFHTQKWVRGLLNAGMQVSVFSFFEGKIEGAECVRIQPKFLLNGKITYFSYLGAAGALRKELVDRKVDVLNPVNVTPYGVWGERSGFKPLVHMAMGADILEYPPRLSDLSISAERLYDSNSLGIPSTIQRILFPVKWQIFRQNVARALKSAALSVGDNIQLVEAMRDWFNIPENHLRLNRWGIEEEFFAIEQEELESMRTELGIRKDARLLLSPRGLKPVYQGDIILKAFGNLLEKGVDSIHFVVLSAGYAAPNEVQGLAEKLDHTYENFTFVKDLIPREKMGALWKLTDAFVIAPVYDGYSNALNEGRYVGSVPILNDIPAHREMMMHNENCWMVSDFSEASLEKAIEDVFSDFDKLKTRFAISNLEWVEREAMFPRNIELFLEAVRHLAFPSTFSASPKPNMS
ncbi:MAG: glycosyltransferase [Bacteroidia bacterium]|nr:glycosyltransferase [Bacteroidia bacterium]